MLDPSYVNAILVSTMNDLPGYEVTHVYGEVFGLVVRSRHMFSNIGASFRTIFGGEVRGYTDLLTTTRHEAVGRLRHEAASVGANAILMMRFDTGVFAGVMNEVAAYGTAVSVRPIAASGDTAPSL
ncbi:MAG: heavy metal-binding domain-containing protein [Acidimicrobiia bacterium]|nr:heavy metal-binding domain-containing protein [Acidimicrobiia bacterium]